MDITTAMVVAGEWGMAKRGNEKPNMKDDKNVRHSRRDSVGTDAKHVK